MNLALWLRRLFVRADVITPAPSGSLELPSYAIVGDRPVMAERTEDGGMRILAYDWKTGELAAEGA